MDIDRENLHFRNNKVVGFKDSIHVSWGTFSENIFVSKSFFLLKFTGLSEKSLRTFGEVVSGKVVIIPFYYCRGKFQGDFCSKQMFFSLFPDLEQKLDYWKNIKLNLKTLFYVSGGIFVGKTYFLELFDIFFLVFRAKKCNFWKEFPQNCKNMIQHVWRNVLMKLIFLTKDVFS